MKTLFLKYKSKIQTKTTMSLIATLCTIFFAISALFADEVPNTVGAVKNAKPGDYIVLKDGSHYVLVEEEISIANGDFDYNAEALKKNEVPRSDGGIEYNITAAHKRIVWSDKKTMDILTTTRAFDSYLQFLSTQYDVIPYVNNEKFVGNSFPAIVPEGLTHFRGKVYHTFLTNGIVTYDYINSKEFNRTQQGDGVERCYQAKGGNIRITLSGGGNLNEAGSSHDE